MIIFIVNENYTSSVVSEIFQYKQTDRQTNSILLLLYKDKHRTKCKIKRIRQHSSEQLFL